MDKSDLQPLRFLDQPIEVFFNSPPTYEKSPPCPDRFVWEKQTYLIVEKISEWKDFTRRGRDEAASARGSLNVGRFYFRVQVDTGQVFDLTYDRAMKNVDDRKGQWLVYREMSGISKNGHTLHS